MSQFLSKDILILSNFPTQYNIKRLDEMSPTRIEVKFKINQSCKAGSAQHPKKSFEILKRPY